MTTDKMYRYAEILLMDDNERRDLVRTMHKFHEAYARDSSKEKIFRELMKFIE
jgi:hypothetical protein